jgi:hypothetical protein
MLGAVLSFTLRLAAFVLPPALALPPSLVAQVPEQVPRPDSTYVDSAQADTMTAERRAEALDRYLESAREAKELLPVMPRVGGEGPLPAFSRLVLTRDSLDWASSATVADLLTRIPGVYIWRGGWIGRPEMPNFQGRGATSVE